MPDRRTLADTRRSVTHKVHIDTEQGQLSVYFTVSFFEDGAPAEVFINAGKTGSTVRGVLDDLARLLSYTLQYGVPYEDLFERMWGSNYPPQGPTSDPNYPACKSITDYLFRWLLALTREEQQRVQVSTAEEESDPEE